MKYILAVFITLSVLYASDIVTGAYNIASFIQPLDGDYSRVEVYKDNYDLKVDSSTFYVDDRLQPSDNVMQNTVTGGDLYE